MTADTSDGAAASRRPTRFDDGLDALRSPFRINSVELANRMVLGPAGAHSPTPDGRPSAETLAFFKRRARGRPGLIIVGGTTSTTSDWEAVSKSRPNTTLRLDSDDFLPGLQALAAAIHDHGVPVFAQINTGLGRMGVPGPDFIAASPVNVFMSEQAMVCVMPVPGGMTTPPPRAASLDEIAALERETVESALRMREAGFDGVEIGAHMSYFLASFLSFRTNRRLDDYGGSPENRARIVVTIIRAIRAATGPDFPIGVRMTAAEHVEGGQGPEDYAALAGMFEKAGADYIALTDGGYESMDLSFTGNGAVVRHGEAAIFRQTLSIPILLQGIHDPLAAAQAIEAGAGDMVMLVRPMFADPSYPEKVLTGRAQNITACRNGNYCLKRILLKMPVRCPVNPSLGREVSPGLGGLAKRMLLRPVEALALKLTSSRRFMSLAARLAPKG